MAVAAMARAEATVVNFILKVELSCLVFEVEEWLNWMEMLDARGV